MNSVQPSFRLIYGLENTFGGVYEVLVRLPGVIKAPGYVVELTDQHASLIGRLKLKWKRTGRQKARKLENCVDEFQVLEITREEYQGAHFPGYEGLNHRFDQLEKVFRDGKRDWKAALENVKGVYLITDALSGKRYVGSAYGDTGIWSRWNCYMTTVHGYNDDLTRVIRKEGIKYAQENFHFSILEICSMKSDDQSIITRESYWKDVLLTRGKFGYNKN